eukprot:6521059-Prorocentrum_lima.AAC.1
MTSSLVGSEMCIRDRVLALKRFPPIRVAEPGDRLPGLPEGDRCPLKSGSANPQLTFIVKRESR